jgi:hypothetical protein
MIQLSRLRAQGEEWRVEGVNIRHGLGVLNG